MLTSIRYVMFAVDLTTCMYKAVGCHARRYEQLTLRARKDAGVLTLPIYQMKRAKMVLILLQLCAVELAAQRIK